MVFGKRRLDLSAVCQRHGKIEANQWRINASVQRRAIKVDCMAEACPVTQQATQVHIGVDQVRIGCNGLPVRCLSLRRIVGLQLLSDLE